MTSPFFAVILAGGGGERFWPFSTPARPKQFLDVFGGRSLIRQAAERVATLAPPENLIVITGAAFAQATQQELPFIPPANIIAEPCRRDTAPACALACGEAIRRGGADSVVAILPADHVIADAPSFRRILADAAQAARKTSSIVTLGIAPTRPATGFGYIKLGAEAPLGLATPFRKAERFVEKPSAATAMEYLSSGSYVWNAGMFVWRAAAMRTALQASPQLAALADAVASRDAALPLHDLLAQTYPSLERISIDYAVMEKSPDILVGEGTFGWDDVGTWAAADAHLPQDSLGCVRLGASTLLDCENTVCVQRGDIPVAAIGVKDLIVAATETGVLVAAKNRAADLKLLLAKLNSASWKNNATK